MRTLNSQEIVQIAGGAPKLVVDVNVAAHYVHINLVENGQVVKAIFNLDWSKLGQPKTTTA